MFLSKNFPLSEFEFSQTAQMRGIDNTMPEALYPSARALAQNILQPIRDALRGPLALSSAYRCQALERLLKRKRADWVSESQHTKGEAADMLPPGGMNNVQLVDLIVRLGLPFDQLILEMPFTGWVHVSHRADGKNRREVRTWLGGSNYPMGIVLP